MYFTTCNTKKHYIKLTLIVSMAIPPKSATKIHKRFISVNVFLKANQKFYYEQIDLICAFIIFVVGVLHKSTHLIPLTPVVFNDLFSDFSRVKSM